jgi:fibronectin-binding autotransporter adhesin
LLLNRAVSLTSTAATINVAQGIYAVGGAGGGNGSASDGTGVAAAGGGGGGSYGGGGGGGGAGVGMVNAFLTAGGGGGGGYYGGGGAAGTSAGTAGLNGGSGGGAGVAGQGPTGTAPTTAGGQFSGGSGVGNIQSGGAWGAGGLGGANSDGSSAGAGRNVIDVGGVAGSTLTLNASTGIGTAVAPVFILAPTISLSAPLGSIFSTAGSDVVYQNLLTAPTGTVSISAQGSIFDVATINAASVTFSTLAGSNGSINLNYNAMNLMATGGITATALTLNANGNGSIESDYVYGIYATTLTATSGTGNILLEPSLGNKIANLQFSTAGSKVTVSDNGNLVIKASSNSSANGTTSIIDQQGAITIAGAVTTAGSASFNGGTGLAVNAQVTAPGGVSFNTIAGTITSPIVITNTGFVGLYAGLSGLGALSVNTPAVVVVATGATITDTYTGFTSLYASGSVGYPAGNLTFTSLASNLNVYSVSNFANNVYGPGFTNVVIKDTSATGSIVIPNIPVIATNSVALSTVGGNISSAISGVAIQAPTLSLATTSGNIIGLGGNPAPFTITASSVSIAANSLTSTVNLFDPNNVALTAVTANNFSFSGNNNIDIAGRVAAATTSITTTSNILQTTATGIVVGTNVTLNASNAIGSSSSPSGLNVSIAGTNSSLNLFSQEATVTSTGALNLGTSNVAALTVTSASTLTQSGVVNAYGSANLTGASFVQATGGLLDGNNSLLTNISATLGSANSVVINGTINALNLSVIAPATGTVTVATGGLVIANASFQGAVFNIVGTGVIETIVNPRPSPYGTITFSNPTGSLSLGGTGTLATSQYLTLSSGGNIVVSPQLNSGAPTVETITAKGTVSLPSNVLSVSRDYIGNGGTIAVTASSLLLSSGPTTYAPVSSTNPLTFDATVGTNTSGNGGSISLTLTGVAPVTIGGATSQYIFNAPGGDSGGNGGTVNIKTAGALSFTPGQDLAIAPNSTTGASAGGNGGNLSLIAGTNLSINGSLATTPGTVSASNWGSITLGANSVATAPFSINNVTVPVNGISGTISGGNITITNASGIAINGLTTAITVNDVIGNPTPTLTLNTNIVSGSGTMSNSNALVINSTGNLTLSNTVSYGSLTSLTVNAKGNVALPTGLLNSSEGYVSLTSTGTLTLPTGVSSITVSPVAGSQNGGTIYINALAVAPSNLITLTLNAQGGTTGTSNSGGNVTYITGNAATLDVGGGGIGTDLVVNISAGTTPTAGGSVTIQNKGGITLNAGGIVSTGSPSIFNNVSLISTAGAFIFNQDLSTLNVGSTNGAGGNLVLQDNSATTLTINTGATLSVGTFTISNAGGAVQFNSAITATAAPATGYAANVIAKTNISQTTTSDIVSGPSISLQSTTGNIGTATTPFFISGTSATGTNVSIGTGAAGIAYVQDTSGNGDVITSATTGSQFIFTAGGSLQTLQNIKETTLVDLTASGAFTQAVGTSYTTKTLDFLLGTMSAPLYTNASIIGGAAGEGSVTGAANTNPTINIIDTTTGVLTLGTTGASGVAISTENGSGTISIVSGGSIVVNNNIGGGANASGNTILTAGKGGTITETTAAGVTANITGTNLLSLTSANLGTATTAFGVTGGTIYIASATFFL